MANLSNTTIPRNIHEALESNEWKKVVQEEMAALIKNNTWKLVPRPKGKKTVGCKWLFTVKYKAVWTGINQDLWRKVSHKPMGWTI